MRFSIGLAAVLIALGAVMPATATAAAPLRHTTQQSGVLCDFATDLGDVLVQVQDFDGATFAGLLMWAPGAGPDDDPVIASISSTVTLTDSFVEASFELGPLPTEETPEPAPTGTAYLIGTLRENGEPTDLGSRIIRDGNRRYDLEITSQLWSVEGTLTVDTRDGSAREGLDACGAGIVTQTTFATNPNAYLSATDQLYLRCSWITAQGAVSLLSIVDDYNFLTQVTVVDGDRFAIGFDSPVFSEDAFTTSVSFEDPLAGVVIGSAEAEAALAPSGDRITDTYWEDPYRFSVIGERLAVDGTMRITLDGVTAELEMDDALCEAGNVKVQVMERMPRG